MNCSKKAKKYAMYLYCCLSDSQKFLLASQIHSNVDGITY